MKEVGIVGLDIAKRLFQVHVASANGSYVLRKKFEKAEILRHDSVWCQESTRATAGTA